MTAEKNETRLAPILSKDEFIKVMSKIKEQDRINCEVADALEKVIDGHFVFGSGNKWYEALIKTLKIMFADESWETIEWWLYEDVEKEITFDDYKYNVESPGDLYDYLIEKQVLPKINNENNMVIGNKLVADLEYTLQERDAEIEAESLLGIIYGIAQDIFGDNLIALKLHEGYYETADLNLILIIDFANDSLIKQFNKYIEIIELKHNITVSIENLTPESYDKKIGKQTIYDIKEIFKKE